jgi:hypothetical protein
VGFQRRAWDSNPQVLSDNGFQVMERSSQVFLPKPEQPCLCRPAGVVVSRMVRIDSAFSDLFVNDRLAMSWQSATAAMPPSSRTVTMSL